MCDVCLRVLTPGDSVLMCAHCNWVLCCPETMDRALVSRGLAVAACRPAGQSFEEADVAARVSGGLLVDFGKPFLLREAQEGKAAEWGWSRVPVRFHARPFGFSLVPFDVKLHRGGHLAYASGVKIGGAADRASIKDGYCLLAVAGKSQEGRFWREVTDAVKYSRIEGLTGANPGRLKDEVGGAPAVSSGGAGTLVLASDGSSSKASPREPGETLPGMIPRTKMHSMKAAPKRRVAAPSVSDAGSRAPPLMGGLPPPREGTSASGDR